MREPCRTVAEALPHISTLEELEGYAEGLKELAGDCDQTEWAWIADKRIEFQRKADRK